MKNPLLWLLLLAVTLLAFASAEGQGDPLGLESEATESPPIDQTSALFDIGVLIGKVEQGTSEGSDPDSLVSHLVKLREQAAAVGAEKQFLAEIDALVEAMERTGNSRDLHGRIVDLRKSLATAIDRLGTGASAKPAPDDSVPFDCDVGSWEGVWETNWGDMTLVFDDEGRFFGTYGSSQNAVRGTFDPDHPKVLRGRWDHFGSTAAGGIRFEMKAPNRFEGGWSSEIPVVGAGSGWSGTRRRTHHSEVLIVPVGEAAAGELPDTETVAWTQPFLVKKGFSVQGKETAFPFMQIHTLVPETGKWEKWGPLYDGTGAALQDVPAGRTFTIHLSLPEEPARRQFVVEFGREADGDGVDVNEDGFITLRTRPLRLVPPKVNRSALPADPGCGVPPPP